MRGRAIWRAYQAANDALSRPCECGASPGTWCTKADGRVARIPHLSRAKSGTDLATAYTDCVEVYADAGQCRDYSEPLHALEERS